MIVPTQRSTRAWLTRAVLATGMLGGGCDSRAPTPPSAGQNPFAAASAVAPSEGTFSARVLERLPAGSYVYLRVERPGSGPTWVVTAEALAPDVERVRVRVVKRVDHFESARLKRTFSPLGFAIVRKDDS